MDEYSASRFEPERQLARPSCRNFIIQHYYDEEYNASRVLAGIIRKENYSIDDEEEKKKKKKKR